jgi:hypothetical protein
MSRFIVAAEKRDIPVAKLRYSIHELGTCRTGGATTSRICSWSMGNSMTILSLPLLASAYLAEQMRTGND